MRLSQDSVPAAECRFVVSQSSNAVLEWDSHNQRSDPRSVLERAGRCIRRDRLPADVPWEWVRPVWYRRLRLQVLAPAVAPAPRRVVQDSVMFRVE